jgi:magnesium transporter
MNFSVLLEHSWRLGFPVSTATTLIAALPPLLYIKRKGWLQ